MAQQVVELPSTTGPSSSSPAFPSNLDGRVSWAASNYKVLYEKTKGQTVTDSDIRIAKATATKSDVEPVAPVNPDANYEPLTPYEQAIEFYTAASPPGFKIINDALIKDDLKGLADLWPLIQGCTRYIEQNHWGRFLPEEGPRDTFRVSSYMTVAQAQWLKAKKGKKINIPTLISTSMNKSVSDKDTFTMTFHLPKNFHCASVAKRSAAYFEAEILIAPWQTFKINNVDMQKKHIEMTGIVKHKKNALTGTAAGYHGDDGRRVRGGDWEQGSDSEPSGGDDLDRFHQVCEEHRRLLQERVRLRRQYKETRKGIARLLAMRAEDVA